MSVNNWGNRYKKRAQLNKCDLSELLTVG